VEELMAESVAGPRFYMLLVGTFAAIAMLIAAVGVYGTLNYMVTQRTHEIGVRMALGAARGHLLSMIVRQGFAVVLAGMFFRAGRRVGLHARPADPVVPRQAERRHHLRGNLSSADVRGTDRVLRPRPSRHAHRPPAGAARRINVALILRPCPPTP